MKRWKRAALFLGAIVATICVGIPCYADKLSDAEAERQRLEQRRVEAEEELASLELEKTDLMSSIEKMDKQLEKINKNIEAVDLKLETATVELEQVTLELDEAEQVEEQQYQVMKKRLKYMYENGSFQYLDIILESNGFSELLNRFEYVNQIAEYDKKMLLKYKEVKEEVSQKKIEAQEKKEKLDLLKEEAELEKTNMEKLVEKKQKQLNEYEDAIESKSQEMIGMAIEIAKKEDEIEKMLLERAKENGPGMSGSGEREGNFIWPLSIAGRISSRFGPRVAPVPGASTYHKGIDIAAPTGTSIVAVAAGTVVTATYSSSAGNYVMINHGNGVYTAYMHASKLLCKVGDTVPQGKIIAEVGSTGYSSGPHLHFSVIVDGIYVNPEHYLPM